MKPEIDRPEQRRRGRLIRVISISIGAAVVTISLKFTAWLLTGSVGLLSDAAESVINLVAAVVALAVILWATRPADEDHAYGHEKADYLAAGFEGALIVLAAVWVAYAAIERLFHPAELSSLGIGIAITSLATVINLGAARILIRAGREESSTVLHADGKHLMADVWTSTGVIAGIVLVWLTGWQTLDSLIALLVALNIVRTGTGLVREALGGLMDRALPEGDLALVHQVLDGYRSGEVSFHALRTRAAGRRSFISIHVLVPGHWTVQRGHDLAERIEGDLRARFDQATVFTHLEPMEDPASFEDTDLDRHGHPE